MAKSAESIISGSLVSIAKHLKKILFEYNGTSKIIVVLDNVAYHHANKIKDWPARA